MTRVQDLQQELEELGSEIEEEVLRERGHRSCSSSPSSGTPVHIQLDITPHAQRRLSISISVDVDDDKAS